MTFFQKTQGKVSEAKDVYWDFSSQSEFHKMYGLERRVVSGKIPIVDKSV